METTRSRNRKYDEKTVFLDGHKSQEDDDDNGKRKRSDRRENGSLFTWDFTLIVALILAILLCTMIVTTLHVRLPDPKEPVKDGHTFSEVRARPLLDALSDLGPKPTGSEACEVHTVNLLYKELQNIKASAHPLVRFEVEQQKSSGCVPIDKAAICYRNVSNVVVRLSKPTSRAESALLFNCHFDSWPTSPAGSDDLTSCAIAVELARVLSANPYEFDHSLILLFNGAEESWLQASHGFITQHRWRHSIRAFINLEASGSGGAELLFQAGPGNEWLLHAYLAAAPFPHCTVIGQEVFQSGKYPGETDFRIFRDHGRVPGLDLAFVQNGYWWHTEWDTAQRVRNGSMQRAGENILAVAKRLLAMESLRADEAGISAGAQKTVFFDVFGLGVVIYPKWVADFIAFALAALSLVELWWSRSKERNIISSIILSASGYVILWISIVALIFGVVKYAQFFGLTMRWYTHHINALSIYGLPVFFAALFLANRLSDWANISSAHNVFLAVVGLKFSADNLASGYLFTFLLMGNLAAGLSRHNFWRVFTPLSIVIVLFSTSLLIYTSVLLLSVFIPIMGRTTVFSEEFIALGTGVPATFVALAITPFISARLSRSVKFRRLLASVAIVSAIIAIGVLTVGLFTSPYQFDVNYPTTRRSQFYHVRRDVQNRSSEQLLMAIAADARGVDDIPWIGADANWRPDPCLLKENATAALCHHPHYFPERSPVKYRHFRQKSVSEHFRPEFPTKVEIVDWESARNRIRHRLRLSGGPHLSVQFAIKVDPSEGFNDILEKIVVFEEGEPFEYDNRHQPKDAFLFLTTTSSRNASWIVDVTVRRPGMIPAKGILSVGCAAHYLFGPEMQSGSLRGMLAELEGRRSSATEWDAGWATTASAWNVHMVVVEL